MQLDRLAEIRHGLPGNVMDFPRSNSKEIKGMRTRTYTDVFD